MFRLSRSTLTTFAGLLIGIAGLLVQWVADPAKFGGFPPGIAFVVGAGLLTLVTARWWWHAVFGAFISFWIVGVGGLAGELTPNLFSSNPGTVSGNVIMSGGLALAFVAGIVSMVTALRTGRSARRAPAQVRP